MIKKKILLVDDEVGFGRAVRLNLEAEGGYEVNVLNRGTETLETARRWMPDLILLDLVMPDVDGSEVARLIRGDRDLKGIPIVFLTATVTREEAGSHGGVIGGETFLAKPVTVEELVKCIEEHTR